ncbi:flagellar motor switch protein FliG [Thalassococcus sp. S3]|nr:flagellar motor switch protein FliG [Thalassococcus sp. S3]
MQIAKVPAETQEAAKLVPRKLGRRAKAAVVVRLLLNEGADIPLEALPDDLQAHLTEQMGAMGLVDRATLASVIEEFSDELASVGLSFPKGLAGALSALDGKLSPQTAARLRKEAGVRQSGDPWARIRSADLDDLLEIVEAESTEIAAVMLSKLDVGKAAELLGRLPGPKARRITYAVSQTEEVTPEAVDRIGLSLASQLDMRPILAFEDGPVQRVGAILNCSAAATRDDVLDGLDETDSSFADAVRKAIFTFAHIPHRVLTRDVPRVVRDIDQAVLVTALAGSTEEEDKAAADFVLSNMSSRLAESLREEMAERGKVKLKDADAARTAIVAAIRTLETAGDLTLIVPEDDDEA